MYALEIDQKQNLLVIRYGGSVGPDETKQGLEQVRTSLSKLKRGFRLLADLTEMQSMDVACAPHIEKAMDLVMRKVHPWW
jgi:hypothetical protein